MMPSIDPSRHNDLPYGFRENVQNDLTRVNLNSNLSAVEPWASDPYTQTDLPKIRRGKLGGQVKESFHIALKTCPSSGPRSPFAAPR